MQKILVAIDGSESCYKAAKKAEELALLCQASLTFITIVDPKLKLLTSKEKLKNRNENIKQEVEKSRRILDRCESIYGKCKESIEDNNIKVNKVVKREKDNPASDICRYAEEENFDLIVLADKGESNIKKFLLGSTAEKIVRHAKTTVVVVK